MSLRFQFDRIVLGGGLGGLAAGALLAEAGSDLALLEGHSAVGGCAGYFDRYDRAPDGSPRRFRFDVGATTVSGVGEHGPLRLLFEKLGRWPQLAPVEPGMICHLPDGRTVVRHGDLDRWIAECERVFGAAGQRPFWEEVAATDRRAWELSSLNRTFPPKTPGDLLRMIRPANILNAPLLRYIWTSVLDVMRRHRLERDQTFGRFIDELLMITAQNRAGDTPFLIGAMGLAYPADTWYPYGGMYALAELMAGEITARGGQVRTKRKVTSIRRTDGWWTLETTRGERYSCRELIANATIYDMAHLMSGEQGKPFARMADRAGEGWGAFTLYCAAEDTFEDGGTLYHQIHTDELPWCGAGAIFVSLSARDDGLRAPRGWRIVTVSTHIERPWEWEELPEDEYRRRKEELRDIILRRIGCALAGFGEAPKKFILAGTPRTFRHYTNRLHGMVGGVPHSLRRNILFLPKFRTPLPGLYLVGDTVYPGQGAPGVVLGALNLVREIGG